MKKSSKIQMTFVIIVLLLTQLACNGEIVADPQQHAGNPVDPAAQSEALKASPVYTQANAFEYLASVADCEKPAEVFWSDELEGEVVLCSQFSGEVTILDAAMAGTLVSPLPGDEAVVGAVWVADKITKVILVAATAYQAGVTIGNLLEMARHSDKSHNPNFPGTQARANIEALLAAYATLITQAINGGPNHGCGSVNDAAGNVVRWVIWVADTARATGGYIVTINLGNPLTPYVGSYDLSRSDWEKGMDPTKLERANQTWNVDVGCPGSLPKLQPATAVAP